MNDFEPRRFGQDVTLETRADSHETVDKRKRYTQILEILKDSSGMTAKQIAVAMYRRGQIPTPERNFSAPRLTELGDKGIVEPIGKTTCEYTGKKVSVWAVRRSEG